MPEIYEPSRCLPTDRTELAPESMPDWLMATNVAAALDRDTGGQGWAVVPVPPLLGGPLGREFTRALGLMVAHRLFESGVLGDMNGYRFNYFEANDGQLPERIVGERTTFKTLHFDPHAEFFLHFYESSINLTAGRVFLTDVRSYLQDTGLELSDVFRPRDVPFDPFRPVAQVEHLEPLLAAYSEQIEVFSGNRPIILCVRNHWHAGVAHGVDHLRPKEPDRPWERRFTRVSLSPLH